MLQNLNSHLVKNQERTIYHHLEILVAATKDKELFFPRLVGILTKFLLHPKI